MNLSGKPTSLLTLSNKKLNNTITFATKTDELY